MKEKLLFLWQLPQNIIGFILKHWCQPVRLSNKAVVYACGLKICPSACCLGDYIFINVDYFLHDGNIIQLYKHEHGHRIQSKYLGFFYLLLVGLPSVIAYWYDYYFHTKMTLTQSEQWYYSLLWEKSADKLGGVDRC